MIFYSVENNENKVRLITTDKVSATLYKSIPGTSVETLQIKPNVVIKQCPYGGMYFNWDDMDGNIHALRLEGLHTVTLIGDRVQEYHSKGTYIGGTRYGMEDIAYDAFTTLLESFISLDFHQLDLV